MFPGLLSGACWSGWWCLITEFSAIFISSCTPVITHTDDSHRSKAFSSVCLSVCLFVCPIKTKRLKLQSRSQGHKIQKHIEGNRVAATSYAVLQSIECPSLINQMSTACVNVSHLWWGTVALHYRYCCTTILPVICSWAVIVDDKVCIMLADNWECQTDHHTHAIVHLPTSTSLCLLWLWDCCVIVISTQQVDRFFYQLMNLHVLYLALLYRQWWSCINRKYEWVWKNFTTNSSTADMLTQLCSVHTTCVCCIQSGCSWPSATVHCMQWRHGLVQRAHASTSTTARQVCFHSRLSCRSGRAIHVSTHHHHCRHLWLVGRLACQRHHRLLQGLATARVTTCCCHKSRRLLPSSLDSIVIATASIWWDLSSTQPSCRLFMCNICRLFIYNITQVTKYDVNAECACDCCWTLMYSNWCTTSYSVTLTAKHYSLLWSWSLLVNHNLYSTRIMVTSDCYMYYIAA